uniref:C-type lectin domain-containing protein n=1 Tax=Poecilia latipinna TaxID=48699 RepID=A0A3B3TJP0_9TELE
MRLCSNTPGSNKLLVSSLLQRGTNAGEGIQTFWSRGESKSCRIVALEDWTQTYCRQTHTDLATILSSEEKNRFMSTLSSAGHSSDVWFGLFNEIDWKWSDGFTGSGADYRHWRTSVYEPSFHYAVEFCVMFPDYAEWYDVSCSQNRPFVCYKG